MPLQAAAWCRATLLGIVGLGISGCTMATSETAHQSKSADKSFFDQNRCGVSAPLFYVSSYSEPSRVLIYRQDDFAHICGLLTKDAGIELPSGLFVDTHENLWVAEFNAVLEFAKGATTPELTLGGLTGVPFAVAVDPNDGTVYVANNDEAGVPGVQVYAAGSTAPERQISDHMTDGCEPQNIGIDARGSIYVPVAGFATCAPAIYRFAKGSSRGVALGVNLTFPQSIQMTESGAAAVCDTNTQNGVTTCGLIPKGTRNIVPAYTFVIDGQLEMVLKPAETAAFMSGEFYVTEWAWPGPDQAPLQEISSRLFRFSLGVAVSPADPPGRPFE